MMENRDGMYGRNDLLETGYTVEYHLKTYAESENATERHKVLWYAWNQNKRWIAQLLEWTLSSFPTYSYHNSTHADTVLHNIERLLGESRIQQLSASDCFVLLHAAYMHDIGMSISASERENMMQDEKFRDLVEYLEKEGDLDMKKAAESVLQTQYTTYREHTSRERGKKLKDLFHQKLDVYYGLSQIMAEYQRRQHAEKVKKRMHQWTTEAEKLGNGFSVSGIPLRIFLRIADCASIHTANGIEPVLELPMEDSGYVLDMIHPRFVAVMLQLGDALDMDNDRFNPFISQFAGNFPRTSSLHFKKHQSIRQLKITPEVIQIQADCDSQDVLRLVRMECESLEEILKNSSYHWAEIAPPGLSGCLPVLNRSLILLDGQKVPAELVKAQFNISQVRAFRLLEGANVYGGKFVFLREVIQNAIDASKLQCWEDYIYRCKLKERKIMQDDYEVVEYGLNASEREVLSEVDVWDYPVELYFEIGVRVRKKDERIAFVPVEKAEEEEKEKGEYGVLFTVRDHGTGISKEDLIKISDVGSSYEEKRHFIDRMPDWLKPTGQFGIGLQSAFLVVDTVVARTYTRSGEKYEITFNKVSNGSGGYINVKPLLSDDYVTFGTTFEIFLSNKYKRPHADCREAWDTESENADRFAKDYEKNRPVRHAQEMLAQMLLYIDQMLGENLFPIYAKIRGNGYDKKHYEFIKSSVSRLVLEADVEEKPLEFDKDRHISWLFKGIRFKDAVFCEESNSKRLLIVNIKDGIGALDCDNAKLYIWNNVHGVLARFGGRRMLSQYSSASLPSGFQEQNADNKRKTKIYLKGIYVQSHCMYQDNELLEVIDIKGGKIGKSHITINRSEFTKEGLIYLENEIYPAIISSAKATLTELNERAVVEEERWGSGQYKAFDRKIMDSIAEKAERCMKYTSGDFILLKRDLEETLLSAVGLSYFLRVLGKEKRLFCEKRNGKMEICKWDELLNQIVVFRRTGKVYEMNGIVREIVSHPNQRFDEYIDCGMLHKMEAYHYGELKRTGLDSDKSIMDYASMLLETRKMAIISIRHNKYAKWFYIPIIISETEKNSDGKTAEEKDAYEIFEKHTQTAEEEKELLEKMEHWADEILDLFQELVTVQKLHEEYGVESDIQYTLNYMLNNIPTVALYANNSEDGNVRINVLSAKRGGGVFYNKNMRRLILKKADSLYKKYHAKRFVTPVWRSYECMALQEVPSSVSVVNAACIAKQQINRMLLPVPGENMNQLLNLKEQEFFKDIKRQKEKCERLKEACDQRLSLYVKFQNVIQGVIRDKKKKFDDSIENLLYHYLDRERVFENEVDYSDERLLIEGYNTEINQHVKDILKKSSGKDQNKKEIILDVEKEMPKIEEFQRVLLKEFFDGADTNREGEKCWSWLIQAVNYIEKYRKFNLHEYLAQNPDMEKFKQTLWEKKGEDAKKNMISYIQKHAYEELSEKQIMNCYEKMLDDMLECVVENETKENNERYFMIEALILDKERENG